MHTNLLNDALFSGDFPAHKSETDSNSKNFIYTSIVPSRSLHIVAVVLVIVIVTVAVFPSRHLHIVVSIFELIK